MTELEVFIPGAYVKDREIDFDAEARSCLGMPTLLQHERQKLAVPPVTYGVLSVLEILDNRFLPEPANCRIEDVAEAVLAAICGKRLLTETQDLPRWKRRTGRFLGCYGRLLVAEYAVLLRHFIEEPFLGFEMLPGRGENNLQNLFGARTMAGAVMICAQNAGIGAEAAIWETPMSLIGHLAATRAKINGEKCVARPKDPADLRQKRQEALEREAAGQLHPWQMEDPEWYEPSATQINARFEILEEWNNLVRSKKSC